MTFGAKENRQGSKSISFSRGRLPTKRTINLAQTAEKKSLNFKTAIPAVILVVLAAVAFSKFAVLDRLLEVSREEAKAAELQLQVDRGYEKIASYGDLVEKYAHYTYSGMTNEELTRADRVKVLDLISRVLTPYATVESWQLSGNVLTLSITGNSLQEINELHVLLLAEPMVDFCKVTTAQTNEVAGTEDDPVEYMVVTARVVVYLIQEVTEE